MSNVLIQKSIINDVNGQSLCVQELMEQIVDTILKAKYVSFEREGDAIDFTFSSSLTISEDTILTNILSSHQSINPIQVSLSNAVEFGYHLIAQYKELNLLRGRTTTEVDQILTDLHEVLNALYSGSLYVAKDRIIAFAPTTLVTQSDKDDFLAKLNAYLGL
jgi:hypothetical protein